MVDWEGLKARWRLGNPIILPSEFPAILAAHERDQAELIRLRERLEMWATDDAGNRFYLPNENTDGISCRDETIKLLDQAHERDQRVIEAAEKLREDILTINRDAWQGEGAICRSIARQSDAALAKFDKAKC